jgi:hypothetical protein
MVMDLYNADFVTYQAVSRHCKSRRPHTGVAKEHQAHHTLDTTVARPNF